MGSSGSKTSPNQTQSPTKRSGKVAPLNGTDGDTAVDSKTIERFLVKFLCSGDVQTSLLYILSSRGCKDAYHAFLKKTLVGEIYELYVSCLANVERELEVNDLCQSPSGDAIWCKQHNSLVASFIADSTYKKWRATEVANVFSAMNNFALSSPTSEGIVEEPSKPRFSFDNEDRTVHSNGSDRSVVPLESVESVSHEVLQSIRQHSVEALSNGSIWLIQFLSLMEEFPLPFTLTKIERKFGAITSPFVYANCHFEVFSRQDRLTVVNGMQMDSSILPPKSTSSKRSVLQSDYFPYWQLGFDGSLSAVSIYAMYEFKSAFKTSHGHCSITMKPIYNQYGDLLFIASFYEPIKTKSIDIDRTNAATRRNICLLENLPSSASEYFEEKCFEF